MKKLTILILLVVASIASKSQSDLPYKALSAFSNDTTAFMIYNFMDRADCYKGKTVKDVKKNLGMPINQYHYFTESESGIVLGMYIYFYGMKRLINGEENSPEISGLKIYWNKSNAKDKQIKNIRRKNKYWTEEVEDIVKDFKISDISVIIEKKSKYYEKYKVKVLKSTNDNSEFSPYIPGSLDD